ncbi:MAG: hypothetical protein AAFQ22_12415 [Pseudomonadota bacterium]
MMFTRTELELAFGSLRATLILTCISIGLLALAELTFGFHFNLLDWPPFNLIANLEVGFGRLMMLAVSAALSGAGIDLNAEQFETGVAICTAYCLVGGAWVGIMITGLGDYTATYGYESEEEMARVRNLLSWSIVRISGPFLWPILMLPMGQKRRATTGDITNKNWPDLNGPAYRPRRVVTLSVLGSIAIAATVAGIERLLFR